MTVEKIRLLVVLVMFFLWVAAVLTAVWDGSTLLKVITPLTTMMMGWLFTAKVTE